VSAQLVFQEGVW